MIETVVQAPGRFDLAFDDPPEDIKKLTTRAYSLLVVTPAPVDAAGIGITNLKTVASYTGIVKGRGNDRASISGYGPAILLTGARQQKDQKIPKRPLYDGNNNSWIRNSVLRLGASESNGISVGTIASSATPTKPGNIKAGQTPLEVLNDVCRRFSRSWRVNPDGTLDVGTRATLWPTTTTPTAIATPLGGGKDFGITGLPSVEFDESDDWDDYTTQVVASFTADDYEFGVDYVANDTVVASNGTYYECILAHTSSGANLPPNATYWQSVEPYGTASITSPYLSPFNSSAIIERRVVDAKNASRVDDADDVASNQLDRFDQAQREIKISSDSWSVPDDVDAGDTIWVYDPENDLYDKGNQVAYQGRVVHPLAARVNAVRDACSEGRGYYLISYDGSAFVLDDLTPYVAYESPSVALEVGEPRRLRARGSGVA